MTREQIKSEINHLKNSLTSSNSSIGDYKVIKACEAMLCGESYEYSAEVRKARQDVRDEINKLQAMLDNGEYEDYAL